MEGSKMERLIKPVEYAHELGISRQAVYAKVKRGVLQSKSVDGKLYIVIEEEKEIRNVPQKRKESERTSGQEEHKSADPGTAQPTTDFEALLKAKDETIDVLKGTVKDLKKSNKQMSTTLRSEIDLLKQAFHEMRNMYITQIEHIRQEGSPLAAIQERESTEESPIEAEVTAEVKTRWITPRKYFKKYHIKKEKKQESLLKKIKRAYKDGDMRIKKERGKFRLNEELPLKDIFK